MATKSFFTDMIIDTPEAAAALEKLIESGVTWKRGDSKFYHPDENFIREFCEKHGGERRRRGQTTIAPVCPRKPPRQFIPRIPRRVRRFMF